MSWNPETHRKKREKVLGVRRQGLSFGMLCLIAFFMVVAGLGGLSLPTAISYMETRHLDDAIYRLQGPGTWPESLVNDLTRMKGVAAASTDTHGTRLVITYDRRQVKPNAFFILFNKGDLKASLLNTAGHRQRMATLAEEREADQ